MGNKASSSVPVINLDIVRNITPCWKMLPPSEFFTSDVFFKSIGGPCMLWLHIIF